MIYTPNHNCYRKVGFVALVFVAFAYAWAAGPELKDGDRVAFLGDGFFQNALRDGQIEAALTMAWPEKKITFRNIGWSGDGPDGRARAFFGNVELGFSNLKQHVSRVQPTVLFIQYGSMAPFEGESGLESFARKMDRLVEELSAPGRRLVILSPTPREWMGKMMTDAAAQNENVARYMTELRSLAQARELQWVDLYSPLNAFLKKNRKAKITTNGVHLNETGYALAAQAILGSFGIKDDVRVSAELRELVLKKNDLYFHQWRPQNETYLFGFRKHEQGQNAAELETIDSFIEAAEAEIDVLKQQLLTGNGKGEAR